MKIIRRTIERYCINHPNFGVSRLMLYIVGASGVVFLMLNILPPNVSSRLWEMIVFYPPLILRGQVWRLITWVFIPVGGNILFTLIALYFYYFIGNTLEAAWGKGKFTVYYLLGILLHIIYGFIAFYAFGDMRIAITMSPIYLNLSMFFAFAVLNPDHTILIMFIIPLKMKWAALINAAFFAFGIITSLAGLMFVQAFFPIVAIMNFWLICGDELMEYINASAGRVKTSRSESVINFKREAKKAKRDMKDKPYRHICAVCGKTDAEFPDMEFRYCSMCKGFHCFCSEHIDNHVHFN